MQFNILEISRSGKLYTSVKPFCMHLVLTSRYGNLYYRARKNCDYTPETAAVN